MVAPHMKDQQPIKQHSLNQRLLMPQLLQLQQLVKCYPQLVEALTTTLKQIRLEVSLEHMAQKLRKERQA
jgi:hypothetical protein